ncbi:MAG: hypothetical protein O3A51_03210 [Verrucomicrobia bacterium]|nr:hypothetical protein [Verrucomicrobiota bacterium]
MIEAIRSPIDGMIRSTEQEDEINKLLSQLFSGPGAEVVLTYLAGITINNINGPGLDTNALIHLEGQRYLYGVIRHRINEGKNGRRTSDTQPIRRRNRRSASPPASGQKPGGGEE